jgi:hypothetical protein
VAQCLPSACSHLRPWHQRLWSSGYPSCILLWLLRMEHLKFKTDTRTICVCIRVPVEDGWGEGAKTARHHQTSARRGQEDARGPAPAEVVIKPSRRRRVHTNRLTQDRSEEWNAEKGAGLMFYRKSRDNDGAAELNPVRQRSWRRRHTSACCTHRRRRVGMEPEEGTQVNASGARRSRMTMASDEVGVGVL